MPDARGLTRPRQRPYRGNSLCMTHVGMFGAVARWFAPQSALRAFAIAPRHESRLCGTRIRLLCRLHEYGVDGCRRVSWICPSQSDATKTARLPSKVFIRGYSWSRAAQIQTAGTYGTIYVESRRCLPIAFSCIKVSVHPGQVRVKFHNCKMN